MNLLTDIQPLQAVLEHPQSLLEGPCFAGDGAAVYSDVIAGGLWEHSPSGSLRELLPKRRGIGGIVAHAAGGWVVSGRNVVHLTADGNQRELLSGDGVCGYNDIGSTPAGDLLVGVLRYRPLHGEDPLPGQLLRLDARGASHILSEQVTWPNGIGVSPDGETIYLSDYAHAVVLAIGAASGSAREFCRSPRGSADGLAVDAEGGVWIALGEGAAVARFHPDGSLDGIVDLPASFVSSLSFGGADMRDVLIATADNHIDPELGGALFAARSAKAGLAVTPVRV
jgi:gluconolactonase